MPAHHPLSTVLNGRRLVTVMIPGEVFAFEGALRNVLRSRGQQNLKLKPKRKRY